MKVSVETILPRHDFVAIGADGHDVCHQVEGVPPHIGRIWQCFLALNNASEAMQHSWRLDGRIQTLAINSPHPQPTSATMMPACSFSCMAGICSEMRFTRKSRTQVPTNLRGQTYGA